MDNFYNGIFNLIDADIKIDRNNKDKLVAFDIDMLSTDNFICNILLADSFDSFMDGRAAGRIEIYEN